MTHPTRIACLLALAYGLALTSFGVRLVVP